MITKINLALVLRENSKLNRKVSIKTKPGFIFLITRRNPDIGTYVVLSHLLRAFINNILWNVMMQLISIHHL